MNPGRAKKECNFLAKFCLEEKKGQRFFLKSIRAKPEPTFFFFFCNKKLCHNLVKKCIPNGSSSLCRLSVTRSHIMNVVWEGHWGLIDPHISKGGVLSNPWQNKPIFFKKNIINHYVEICNLVTISMQQKKHINE